MVILVLWEGIIIWNGKEKIDGGCTDGDRRDGKKVSQMLEKVFI